MTRRVHAVYTVLTCDRPGCGLTLVTGGIDVTGRLRTHARNAHWACNPGTDRDACPMHAGGAGSPWNIPHGAA